MEEKKKQHKLTMPLRTLALLRKHKSAKTKQDGREQLRGWYPEELSVAADPF